MLSILVYDFFVFMFLSNINSYMLKTLHKTKIKNWLTVNRKLQSFAFISTNSLYSEKDFSDVANIIKIRKEKNDLSQPFRLAWNLRPILTPRRCRWAKSVTAFQAEWFGRILATSLNGAFPSLKGSYRYSLWHRRG